MIVDVKDKRIIVTGGAQGLGAACAKVLAQEGAHVYVFDIKDEAGEAIAKEVTAAGPGSVSYKHVDISKRAEVFKAVQAAADESGGQLDAVVNIAGVAVTTPMVDIQEDDFDFHYAVHVKGTLFMCQAAHPFLKANGLGFIVNCASDAALTGVPGTGSYAAAKGAILSLTRTMSMEWGPDEIRVNVINPVASSSMQGHAAKLNPEQLEIYKSEIKRRCPLGGKKGDAEGDIGPVVAFLCSEASRWITGQTIPINGGMSNAR